MSYGKLVRDNIPNIIYNKGNLHKTKKRILNTLMLSLPMSIITNNYFLQCIFALFQRLKFGEMYKTMI